MASLSLTAQLWSWPHTRRIGLKSLEASGKSISPQTHHHCAKRWVAVSRDTTVACSDKVIDRWEATAGARRCADRPRLFRATSPCLKDALDHLADVNRSSTCKKNMQIYR